MIKKKSDDAISPVIGVMLMLVVTVVIAAAVTIFATGVVGDTEPAPVAVLDVEIFSTVFGLTGLYGPDLWITHVSGEPVDTKDIELRFSWTHKTTQGGKEVECTHYSSYSADGMKKKHPSGVSDGGSVARNQALYVKTKGGEGSYGLDNYFGSVILTPGLKLFANSDFLAEDWSGGVAKNTGSRFMDAIFDNYRLTATVGSSGSPAKPTTGGIMEHLQPGTAVDVMIIHLPSNKAIYDNTVIVQ